jgi:hypothetical protein
MQTHTKSAECRLLGCEAVCAARRLIPLDGILHNHRLENLKPYIGRWQKSAYSTEYLHSSKQLPHGILSNGQRPLFSSQFIIHNTSHSVLDNVSVDKARWFL